MKHCTFLCDIMSIIGYYNYYSQKNSMYYHRTAEDVPLANSCTFLSFSLYCALFMVDLVAAVVSWPPPPPGSRHSTVSCTKGGGNPTLILTPL